MSEIPYHDSLEKVFNRPLFVTPQKAHIVGAYLLMRVDARAGGGGSSERPIEEVQAYPTIANADGSYTLHSPRSSRFIGATPRDEKGKPAPYRVHNGVAIITIVGSLCNRGAWIGASSGLVSYEGIMHQLSSAVADKSVKSILLDVESPGGEAIGCFEAAAAVRKAAQSKPVYGLVNGMACSAMYALLSGCTKRITTPSGISGSIGVVMLHLDFSRYLANEGVKPTFIFAGAHKVDGNMYEPLPAGVRDDLQAEVDQFYASFVATVAAGTGLSEKAIRATEARTYIGEEAVKVGLCDQVATIDEILEAMTSSELIQPNAGIVLPGETGDAKSASTIEGGGMSLKSELLTFLGIEAKGVVKPAASADGTPAAVTQPEGSRALAAPDGLVHLTNSKHADGSRARALEASSDDLAEVTCSDCLRAEIAGNAQARITAQLDTFVRTKCANAGKAATEALSARYRVALENNDTAALAELDTIAASFVPPGPNARLDNTGPAASDIVAQRAISEETVGAEAAKQVKAAGIQPGTPQWMSAYSAKVVELRGGVGGTQ
jgi:signal peptide peptidase SppA